MCRQREWLVRAAVELGLRVQTDWSLTLPDGRTLNAAAYFPDLGTEAGMAVFDLALPSDLVSAVYRLGYPASFFGQPGPLEEYDVASYATMFAEWGWAGALDQRPGWMDDAAE